MFDTKKISLEKYVRGLEHNHIDQEVNISRAQQHMTDIEYEYRAAVIEVVCDIVFCVEKYPPWGSGIKIYNELKKNKVAILGPPNSQIFLFHRVDRDRNMLDPTGDSIDFIVRVYFIAYPRGACKFLFDHNVNHPSDLNLNDQVLYKLTYGPFDADFIGVI
jgi:hypothetical protein